MRSRLCEAVYAEPFMRSRLCEAVYVKPFKRSRLCKAVYAKPFMRSRLCAAVYAKPMCDRSRLWRAGQQQSGDDQLVLCHQHAGGVTVALPGWRIRFHMGGESLSQIVASVRSVGWRDMWAKKRKDTLGCGV